MLIEADRSMLLVCDLQARLVPALGDAETVVANAGWLMDVAQRLALPVAATEHYPQGLGPLVPPIRARLPTGAIGSKNRFSAVAAGCLDALPGHDRPQVVLVGAETHVCVLQTALDLVRSGREVYVAVDCVASRRALDRDTALARMRGEGVRVVTREMVAFEWLGEGGTDRFRAICREFLR
jgi:nicotinamidase-related amidase